MSKMFEMLKLLRSNKGNQSNKRKLSGMSDRHRVGRKGWRCVIGRGCARNGTGRNTE